MLENENLNEAQKTQLDLIDVGRFACQFAEWLQENRWFSFINGKWNYTFEHGTSISSASYDKNYRKTTEELYAKFCKERGY